MKTRKKWVALLVAVVMVAALLVPFVGTASASVTYAMTTVNTVVAGTGTPQVLGDLEATFDVPSWQTSTASAVYLSLPSSPTGYAFVLAGSPVTLPAGDIVGGTGTVTVTGQNLNSAGNPTQLSVLVVGGAGNGTATSVTLEVPLTLIVPSGVTGNITLYASAQSGSIFATGQVVVGTVGNSTFTLAVESTPAISSSGALSGVIDVTENAAGALFDNGSTGLKLTLPPGFSWQTNGTTVTEPSGYPLLEWGSSLPQTITGTSNDGRELDITYTKATTTAAFFKLEPTIEVDQSVAQTGNITCTVGGQTSANVSSVVVGSYGNYGLTVSPQGTVPTITAGMNGSTIGELEIAEGIPGSIIWGRTITLTLPSDLTWSQQPSLDTSLSTNTGSIGGDFNTWTSVGSNGNEIECLLPSTGALAGPTAGQSSAGTFFLKSMEVTPAVDYTGPVTVTVGGSEGVTGTATLGTVAGGVTLAAASTPDVSIGSSSQTLGNVTVTELAAGNILATSYYSALEYNPGNTSQPEYFAAESTGSITGYLYVVAPVGVTFDTTPTVTVTSGNLQLGTITTGSGLTIGSSTLAGNQGAISIEINGSSTTASTIQIAAPVVTIDRTVPAGPITFKLEGSAVDETTFPTSVSSATTFGINGVTGATVAQLYPNDTNAAQVNVATVTNGTSTSPTGPVVFTIGQTSYTLNGASVSTDVAPYILDSRTFVPLRAVSNALGVADSGIIWNPTTQAVTIIKGGVVAQFTIGSTTMLLNGAAVTMDVAPQITDGRTCLPIAWAAQALGVTYTWNATAQTVTFNS